MAWISTKSNPLTLAPRPSAPKLTYCEIACHIWAIERSRCPWTDSVLLTSVDDVFKLAQAQISSVKLRLSRGRCRFCVLIDGLHLACHWISHGVLPIEMCEARHFAWTDFGVLCQALVLVVLEMMILDACLIADPVVVRVPMDGDCLGIVDVWGLPDHVLLFI